MNTKVVGVIVAILVLGGVGYVATRNTSKTSPTKSSSSNNQTSPGVSSSNNSSTSTSVNSSGSTTDISITADDSSASKTDISVSKGTKVNLTFSVSQSGVYHGGLQFKSTDPAIDSGPISPGASKTVSFVAEKSFSFTPYWYSSGVKKDYLINVTVN